MVDDLRAYIGKQLKIRRAELDMKRGEAAARARMTEREFQQIEDGQVEPSVTQLLRLATSLKVNPGYFLDNFDGREIILPLPKEME